MVGKNIYEVMLDGQFVPAADKVWREQIGSESESVFIQAMADHGPCGGRRGAAR